jgi:uncharacterized phiE125 gp8 family phage protein
MALKVITPPAVEPITLAEAKLHCRVDGTDENTLISGLIQAAREHIENILLKRALVTQTLEYVISAFPCGDILLPRPPLQSVTSIKYTNSAGAETTIAPADYIVNSDCSPGLVTPAYGKYWPSATLRSSGGIRIRYVAGYGTSVAAALTTNLGVTNGELVFTAKVAGAAGNNITIAYINPGATNTISVVVDRTIITVSLGYATGAITSTAAQVKTALQASANASELILVAYKTGNDGSGIVTALAATLLAGSDSVPQAIKQAILLLVGHLYQNRELMANASLGEMPFAVTALCSDPCIKWDWED